MKISRTFLKTITLTLILASLMLVATPTQPVQAQLAEQQPSITVPSGVTPDIVVPTYAYMSVRPTVVGINQIVLVNLFPLPAPNANRKFKDMKVTITKPDGSQQVVTMDSYVADGTAWFEWIMDKAGTWQFKFEFPGIYYPAGRYYLGYIVTNTSGTLYTQSAYYQPSSSKVINVTVLENYVALSWPEMPLPTDYWTRPIPYEYREWWKIAGDWPWYGPAGQHYSLAREIWDELYPNTNPYWSAQYYFTPWVQGPESPHVVWKRQSSIAGIIGGDYGIEIYNVDIFSNVNSWGNPNIVVNGMAFQSYTKPGSGKTAKTYWMCYDIRTGELYWERPLETGESAPTVIEYFNQGLLPGGAVTGTHEHVTSVYLLSISGGYLRKYSPWTGAMVGNYSISPLTGSGGTYYRNGYVLAVQDLGAAAAPDRYRLINWTTFGTSTTLKARVVSNTSYARSSLPTYIDWQSKLGATISKLMVGGAPANTTIRGFDLITGKELWNVTVNEWQYSGSCDVADHGKIAMLAEQGYYIAFDLKTGKLAWKSETFDYPWDTPAFGAYAVASAYGMIYHMGYTGVYAINWTNGKIVWKYEAPAATPYETPYIDENGQAVYSFNVDAHVVDGKIYVYNTEHSATVPITRGWQLHCINALTGEGIWKVAIAGASSKHEDDIGVIADGYLTLFSSDGYTYCFGKGKSQTSVAVSQDVVAKGSTVLVKGSVLDMSPAQPGTPCVSKESMATWMEYLHKQMPINGIWGNETITGVPVKLCAIKDDGKVIDLGTVTTNGYYGTFSLPWTPEEEGNYTIIASFEGDESYGSSAAATAITVGPPPAEIEIPEYPTPTDYTPMLTALAIAIIIVAVLVIYDIITVRKLHK
ncbi:MAG: PQQ-binding-like beta-propeller repeat protein [Candidatus Bathyarchaeales archaeon]